MNKNPAYSFPAEIHNKLKGFRAYLKKLGNDESTIRQKLNYAGYFLRWTETEGLQEAETSYTDLLAFIEYCKHAGRSRKLINTMLRAVRNYYGYLKNNQ